jgi:hypothetical protein
MKKSLGLISGMNQIYPAVAALESPFIVNRPTGARRPGAARKNEASFYTNGRPGPALPRCSYNTIKVIKQP